MIHKCAIRSFVAMLVVASAAISHGQSPQQAPTADSLAATIKDRHQRLNSEDADVRVAVVTEMFPTEQDFAVLFPDHAGKLVRVMATTTGKILETAKSLTPAQLAEIRKQEGAITKVETLDVRTSKDADDFAKLLGMIPKETPVFRVIIHRDNEQKQAESAHLFLNGHWVFIPSVEQLPAVLPHLDELLKRVEGEPKE